jgi:arsenate reductase (glutaredoxin)
MRSITIYTLKQCSTCRDAVKWLRARGFEPVEKPIRETPPTVAELQRALAGCDGNWRRLVNSSGLEYRALGLAQKIGDLSEAEVLALLAGNGSLVKRPLLLTPKAALVGFDPAAWAAALGSA